MPRQPRLDAPGALHHVIGRGIERTKVFHDDTDRDDFVNRLAGLGRDRSPVVYAWALMPNHFHLLVRTGHGSLAQSMRKLLTGYVVNFNRRHKRAGHLFPNRYKSIVVDEDEYLLELVRYLHLNPVRAKVVGDLRALERYPWTGHSALVGRVPRPWQETATILAHFGRTVARGRQAYRAFVAAGLPQGRRPELQGGGLVRSAGGWAAVAALRRGREAYQGDERILGNPAFVAQCQRAAEAEAAAPAHPLPLARLVARVCQQVGIAAPVLRGGGRRPAASRARAGIAYLWTEVLGHPGRPLAPVLGVHPSVVYQAARRGAVQAAIWHRLIREKHKTT